MKKFFYVMAVVALAAVFTSCTEEEIKPQTSVGQGTTNTGSW